MAPLLRRRASLSRLGPDDLGSISALLDRDPVANVYLRSELRLAAAQGRPLGAPWLSWWGVGSGPGLRALLLGGSLVVPWIPDPEDAVLLSGALPHLPPLRLMIGPAPSVRVLAAAIAPRHRPAEVRDPQPVMVLDRPPPGVPLDAPVRAAGSADLDRLVHASAAMHREEMGVDPLALDPVGWRHRMVTLVERGWSYVWAEGDRILFKVELSAWTPEVLQLQGVWTDPRVRRRGLATRGLAAVCALLLREVPLCSLYVNAYNVPALGLYARLGFRRAGDFATFIYP